MLILEPIEVKVENYKSFPIEEGGAIVEIKLPKYFTETFKVSSPMESIKFKDTLETIINSSIRWAASFSQEKSDYGISGLTIQSYLPLGNLHKKIIREDREKEAICAGIVITELAKEGVALPVIERERLEGKLMSLYVFGVKILRTYTEAHEEGNIIEVVGALVDAIYSGKDYIGNIVIEDLSNGKLKYFMHSKTPGEKESYKTLIKNIEHIFKKEKVK